MPLDRACPVDSLLKKFFCWHRNLSALSSRLLLLFACLFILGAQSQTSYQIYGITGDAKENVEQRLKELTEQTNLTALPPEKLVTHITKALEAYGYFKSSVRIRRFAGGRVLSFYINPGSQLHITSLDIRLEGPGAFNSELRKTIATGDLHVGDPLLTTTYEKTKGAILSTAEHEGYLRGSFTTAVILVNKKKYTADITLVFNTGPQYFFGPVTFNRNHLSPQFLQGFIPFDYGQPYSTEEIIKLNNQLSGSGYFKSVIVKPQLNSQRHVPVDVHLTPVSRYSYTFGAGYGTDTGIRGRAGVHIIPVNKWGHKFNAIAQGSMKENALQAQYLIPGRNPVTQQYALSAGLGHQNYSSGESNSFLASAAYWHTLENHQTILSLNALYDNFRYTGQPRNEEFSLFPKLNYTFSKTTDPLFTPTGYNISFTTLGMLEDVGSSNTVGQAYVDAKAAITLDFIRTRFYFHGIQGFTAIDDIYRLPLSLALFLGGNDNLKAYGINSIGPGKIISFANIEIQKETKDNWYLIGFVDAGDVYNPTPKAFKYDAGAGIMWVSPVGPIKVGFAQAIDNRFRRIAGKNPKLVINMGPDL